MFLGVIAAIAVMLGLFMGMVYLCVKCCEVYDEQEGTATIPESEVNKGTEQKLVVRKETDEFL